MTNKIQILPKVTFGEEMSKEIINPFDRRKKKITNVVQ